MASIEGENLRSVTWVYIEEIKSGDLGIGGKILTTSDAKALAAGKMWRSKTVYDGDCCRRGSSLLKVAEQTSIFNRCSVRTLRSARRPAQV
jgi:hypothetical protein